MAEVLTNENANKIVFIGKAWNNVTKGGKEYMRLTIDRTLNLALHGGDSIELWPNKKREGMKDADFRASIRIPADEVKTQ
jgi:uncharacterized protein (DUF736 family)